MMSCALSASNEVAAAAAAHFSHPSKDHHVPALDTGASMEKPTTKTTAETMDPTCPLSSHEITATQSTATEQPGLLSVPYPSTLESPTGDASPAHSQQQGQSKKDDEMMKQDENDKSQQRPRPTGQKSFHVKGIHPDTTADTLREAFTAYGPVADVYIPRDYYSKRPRGFAYVKFMSDAIAEEAMEKLGSLSVDGAQLSVTWAIGGKKSRDEMAREDRSSSRGGGSYRSRGRSRSPYGGRRSSNRDDGYGSSRYSSRRDEEYRYPRRHDRDDYVRDESRHSRSYDDRSSSKGRFADQEYRRGASSRSPAPSSSRRSVGGY